MSENVEVEKEAPAVLPDINRRALWHEEAGLVVSLNNCPLPNLSTMSRHQPRFFDDSEIWRTFYARNGAFNAPVFGWLDYTGPQILEGVVQLDRDTFSLPDTLISEWSQLKNTLLDVADHSLGTHLKSSLIPPITWPRNPHECGYRGIHQFPVIILHSAMRSQEAFHSLCAIISFILSLWTKPDGLLAVPFRSAFWGLANRNYTPINRSWLDLFSQTHVCNITLGFRPGCFINPYTSCWGPWLVNFVHAGVQVWVVWGSDVIDRKPSSFRKYYEPFLPPLEFIKSVRSHFLEPKALQFPPPFVPANFQDPRKSPKRCVLLLHFTYPDFFSKVYPDFGGYLQILGLYPVKWLVATSDQKDVNFKIVQSLLSTKSQSILAHNL